LEQISTEPLCTCNLTLPCKTGWSVLIFGLFTLISDNNASVLLSTKSILFSIGETIISLLSITLTLFLVHGNSVSTVNIVFFF